MGGRDGGVAAPETSATAQPDNRRILMITPTLAGGGAERVLLNVAEGFAELGYEVHVAVIKNQIDFAVPDGLILHVVDPPAWVTKHKIVQNLVLKVYFRRLLRACGPFALILSNYQSRADFLPKESADRLFFWIHSDYWSDVAAIMETSPRRAQRLMRRITDFFDNRNLIAVSQGAKRSLLENNKVAPRQIPVIYNPLDFGRIRSLAQQSVPEIPTEPYILHVARFEPNKRHDLLFEAFAGVAAPVKLVLLTKHNAELDQLIRSRNLADRVVVAGFQKNPFPWMQQASICVLSSDSGEALPTVLIESLVCGTPVVSADCPYGPNEILTGPLARWLVPVNDAAALRARIEEALAGEIAVPPELLAKFSHEVVMRQYVGLMRQPARELGAGV
jgi:glycosyltransferase involved in cell wall biosynthesis